MDEHWKKIRDFADYSVSDLGRIRKDTFDRIMAISMNQFGVPQVGLFRDGVQYHRSVPLLVAKAFIPIKPGPYDTPINCDGDRRNNRLENLLWRPRWFAVHYNRQFREPYHNRIHSPIRDIKSGNIFENSLECAKYYGILEKDLVVAIHSHTTVWPIYREFELFND